ncbi:MAG: hypothetical protein ACTHQQ_02155, partial [Solirubrobacteraceae bacterium]
MSQPRHRELMTAAIERDAEAQGALLAGDRDAARVAFRSAADLYRRSWLESPPRSYGRLVGMLKSAILAGDAAAAAAFAREALADEKAVADSPTASYARALSALIAGDDADARKWSEEMACGGDAFERAACAITALALRDGHAYNVAVGDVVRDFEGRQSHLTGVQIADTAVMLERLAAARGMASEIESPLMPP